MRKQTKYILCISIMITFVLSSAITFALLLDKKAKVTTSTHSTNMQQVTLSGTKINLEEAKKIALQHAKADAWLVTFLKTEMENDNGQNYYDIDFYQGTTKYEYAIDTKDGAVLSWQDETMKQAPISVPSEATPKTQAKGNYISEAEARALAQAKVPNATFTSFQFEYDDGIAVYEGELREGWNLEYSFKINATDGAFLKWETDLD